MPIQINYLPQQILIGIAGLTLLVGAVRGETPVDVEKAARGFEVTLPAAAIEEAGFDRIGSVPIELRLMDPQLGDTSVSGPVARILKNRLFIKTDGKLTYLPTSRTTIALVRPDVNGFPPCAGIDQPPLVGACRITYCPSVITCGGAFGTCQCLD